MNEKHLIKIILVIVAIGLAFAAYGNWIVEKTRQETIESAILIQSDNDCYVIDFDGEQYIYSFD